MKVLLIGLGSIGRRHLKVLQNIGGLELAAMRTRKGTLHEASDVAEFYNVEAALAFNPDGVVVCNPTSLHVSSVKPFLKAGAKALIEKPIAHSQEEAKKLSSYASQIRVAYCMRFLPVSKYFRSALDLNDVFKVSFKRSFYLPKWHPYADYRKEYTARKDLGGGVIRTLSHEIDLGIHWLGRPNSTHGVVDKLSPLAIDVDDFAFLSMKMQNGARVNLEMDYFSPSNVNIGELFTSQGKYEWNAEFLHFTSFDDNKAQELLKFDQVFDSIYHDQMIDFMEFIENGNSINCEFGEALEINAIIDSVEEQSVPAID